MSTFDGSGEGRGRDNDSDAFFHERNRKATQDKITELQAENKEQAATIARLAGTIEQLVMKDAFGTLKQRLFQQRQSTTLTKEEYFHFNDLDEEEL